MELKTLKGMQTFKNSIGNEVFVHKRQLHEEAKKWIELLDNLSTAGEVILAMDYGIRNAKGISTWIKHFFNLEAE